MTEPRRHSDDVAAGPGDAGREDRPEVRRDAPEHRRGGRQATALFAGLVALGLIVWMVLALAA